MDLGTSVAIFLTLAFVILVLFCLVTRYFQYRMRNKLQEEGEAFSQVDQINHTSDQDLQGQYDDFLEKRKLSNQYNNLKIKQKDYLFDKTQIQEPIKDNNDPIYGVSMLRRRLEGQIPSYKQNPQLTGRSVPSIKSFRPQRMQTGRSDIPSDRRLMPNSNKNPQQPLTKHEYVSRLITYNEQGLLILDVAVSSLVKTQGKIKEKKMLNTIKIDPLDDGFQDQLQVLGFEAKNYNCMKFKIFTQIPYMIEGQQYPISALKTSQSKQQIDFSEYYMLKDKIESSLE